MGVGYLWEVDSAGLAGWNVGNSPTHRALNTMKKHGLRYNNLGRQVILWFMNILYACIGLAGKILIYYFDI